jgi:hypothetical protein
VGLRLLTAALVTAAALSDWAGASGLAFYALLAAVPAAAACALAVFGDWLEGRTRPSQAAVWPLVLVLVVLAASTRADGAVPQLGATALLACLGALFVDALLAAREA